MKEVKKWVIMNDEGKIIGTCDGSKEEARNLFHQLSRDLPWDEHEWYLYEREGL